MALKLYRITENTWVNPDLVTRVEQHGTSTIIYFSSGRERAVPNTKAERMVNILTQGGLDQEK